MRMHGGFFCGLEVRGEGSAGFLNEVGVEIADAEKTAGFEVMVEVGLGGEGVVLGFFGGDVEGGGFDVVEEFGGDAAEESGADDGGFDEDLLLCGVGVDFEGASGEELACVDAIVDPVDGDAGVVFVVFEDPEVDHGAAVGGEPAGVDVEDAEAGYLDDVGFEDL